jgi:hypothetical protein
MPRQQVHRSRDFFAVFDHVRQDLQRDGFGLPDRLFFGYT